jgi:hypothetical protein
MNLDGIFRKHNVESRSISPENLTGERGRGGMATPENTISPKVPDMVRGLGQGWKVQPWIGIPAGKSADIMDAAGPGVIRHIWISMEEMFLPHMRNLILRIWWDGEAEPSVECPVADFFCCSWNKYQNIDSQLVAVNSSGGFNCFFPMPFRRHVRVSVHNDSPQDLTFFIYTINYTLEPVDQDSLYLHAQWRRSNPLEFGTDHVMIDGVRGQGQYVGTFMAWQQNNGGWWGEGEIKMFLDGDDRFPTICGTGTEDYFCGGWCFKEGGYSKLYHGYQIVGGERRQVGTRMTLYRFHVLDPVFFRTDLRITMQDIGWRADRRRLPLQDDIASVVYWYQTEPHAKFPELPGRDYREIV